jgi:hypothetical protein
MNIPSGILELMYAKTEGRTKRFNQALSRAAKVAAINKDRECHEVKSPYSSILTGRKDD